MEPKQRWITVAALMLLVSGTFWTISARANGGRVIWLPFVNSSGVSSAATPTPMPPHCDHWHDSHADGYNHAGAGCRSAC